MSKKAIRLKTLRDVARARLAAASERAEPLHAAAAPTSPLAFEHSLTAIQSWAEEANSALGTVFEDERIGADILGDLLQAIHTVGDLSQGSNTLYARNYLLLRAVGNAQEKLSRLAQRLDLYREPQAGGERSAAEVAVAKLLVRDFNMKHKVRVPTQPPARAIPVAGGDTKSPEQSARQVFISHCSKDVGLAARLVTLLMAAMKPPLRKADILCTSVAGCSLEGGAQTHPRILSEIKCAPVFIALVTAPSVESSYVLFELGARWAVGGAATIPVLGPGEGYSLLPGPWAEVNALRTDDSAKVLQLVAETARALGRALLSPEHWHDEVQGLVGYRADQ